ncbi:MAG TPA: hypothetical protein VNT75_28390, partial [Symbiobacteriaceae bacterium]|nr:hypothetical protein [Symbiobacteriaceae bacterium]
LTGITVEVATDAAKLLALRPVKAYKQTTAGSVVQDLLSGAGAAPGPVEPGVSLPFYALDGSRSAFHHIHELALASGCDAYVGADNRLVFARWTGGTGTPVPFLYGDTIMALETDRAETTPAGAQVAGEGAAGTKGAGKWHWLVKDQSLVQGKAGSGARLLVAPSLRSAEAAQSLASSVTGLAARRAVSGTLRAVGSPSATLGKAIAVAGTPGGALDGIYQIRRVRHWLSAETGFITEIDFIGAGGVA